MSAEKEEEFKYDVSFRTTLQNADIKQSLLKAMFEDPNRSDVQQSQDVAAVMKFIANNVHSTEVEINKLIEANLKFVALNLNKYQIRLNQNQEAEYPYHLHQRHVIESTWINCGMGLHKLMDIVIKAYTNTPNNPNIFYALYTLKGLCSGQNQEIIKKIVTETNIIQVVFSILNSDGNSNNTNKSWIEQFMCVEMIQYLDMFDDKKMWTRWNEKFNLNIIKLLIKISCNCFIKLPYYYRTMKEYQKQIILLAENIDMQNISQLKSQDDIPTYLRSSYTNSNTLTRSLHYWCYKCRMAGLRTLKSLAETYWTKNSLMKDIDSKYLKRLLQISTMTMRQGKQTFPAQVNAIDVLVLLSQNEYIAQSLVADSEIMTNLIICIRSRGSVCEFDNAHLLILMYFIIVQHKVVPRYYFNDLIYALMDTIESEWKNMNVLYIFNIPSTNELTIQTLQYLFGVPQFSIAKRDEYLCVICQSVFNNPHTISCGHSLCYSCFTVLLGTSHTNYEVIFLKTLKPYQCPICRQTFEGKFDRDDKKSSFTLNWDLRNEIYASNIIIDDEQQEHQRANYSDFEGTEYDFWSHLKHNHVHYLYDEQMAKNESIKSEFVIFCEFMEKNSKIYKGNIKAERKNNVLRSRDIKNEGNVLFKHKDHEAAVLKYKEALEICPLFVKDRAIYLSNITLCYLKLEDYVNAFRTAQNGLMLTCSNVKLLNNSSLALSKLLFEDEERKKLNKCIHYKLHVCKCNVSCLNKRVYDILLHQLIWASEFHYCIRKVMNGNDNQQFADNLRTTDVFIQNLRKMDIRVDNYANINFDEYQYLSYLDCKNSFKQKMHDFIVDTLRSNEQNVESTNLTIVMINDLLDIFDFKTAKMVEIEQFVEMIDLNWKNNLCYDFYSKYIRVDVIEFIVSKSYVLEMETNTNGVYVTLAPNFNENKKEYDNIEHKFGLFNDWNDNNEDFIISKLYKWEQIMHKSNR